MRLGGKACCSWTILLFVTFILLVYLHFMSKPNVAQWQPAVQQQTTNFNSQHRSLTSVRSSPRPKIGGRFIIGLNYWEQLTMGMRNLFSLTCFGNLWNMSVVQPFTYNSRLYGFPNFKPDDNINITRHSQDLQIIFNTNSINNALHRKNIPKLTPFKTFLTRAQREVTVLHYIPLKEVHELPVVRGTIGHTLLAGFQHSSVVDCSIILESYKQRILQNLNEELQRLTFNSPTTYPEFTIVKYFCINMSVLTTPELLASRINLGSHDQSESIIVVNWRGTSAQNVMHNTAKGTHLNNRIAMDSPCKNKKIASYQSTMSYSALVTKTTQSFLKLRGLNGEFAAVHIRGEKMGLREPRFPGSFKVCLQKLSQTIDTFVADKQNLSFVYITDYGPYSSDTCRNCKSGDRVLKWLQRQGVKQLEYDPKEFNLPSDSGLAAAIEANVLISAKYLIVCGGGAFQAQVVSRFYNKNSRIGNNNRVLKVCTEESDLK